jgi:DNA-binding NtrC family response regulator
VNSFNVILELKLMISGTWMQGPIVVVDGDEAQCRNLCDVLERDHYPTTALHSLLNLEREIGDAGRRVVILDLDTLPVNNRLFRTLRRTNPGVCIIGTSSRSFHPELEEAMSKYIYACLTKPVDDEELIFWIKSLGDL